MAAVESKAQLAQALLEAQNLVLGSGWISGGTVAAATGLSVTVTAFAAVVGTYVSSDSTISVGIGDATATTFNVFLRQGKGAEEPDAAIFTVRKTSDGVPTDTDERGQYLLAAVITSNGSSVTAVDNARAWWKGVFIRRLVKSVAGGAGATLTAAEYANDTLEFTGLLTGNSDVIVPLGTAAGAYRWTVFNNTTGAYTLTLKGATGTGVVVAQTKRAIVETDGTNVVRVTADSP